MTAGRTDNEEIRSEETTGTHDCGLTVREQTQNLLVFAANMGLGYLAAPVVYVGLTQAALLEALGHDNATSNLPSSVVMCLTPVPIVMAWYFPTVRMLKPVIVSCYLIHVLAAAVVALVLVSPTVDWVVGAVIFHAAAVGIANGTSSAFQWEMLGRGVAESRRGAAFSLAFGLGPILAVLGSLGSQMVLDGRLGSSPFSGLDFRWNFALLFMVTAPIMGAGAWLSTKYILHPPAVEAPRQSFRTVVFGGLREFVSYRIILITVLAYVLVYMGYMILPTITLYTKTVTGEAAQNLVGYQNSLRFGFKVVAGFVLGWLLTRTHPKAGPLVTSGLCLCSVLWALLAPGQWFLLSFGLMGAGELFDAYFRNYIICCSRRSQMRRNLAFLSMIGLPIGLTPYVYGRVVDQVGVLSGSYSITATVTVNEPTHAYQASGTGTRGFTIVLDPVTNGNATARLTGTITDPGTLDTFTLRVNWGDSLSADNETAHTCEASATGTQEFTMEHQYKDFSDSMDDPYTITATLYSEKGFQAAFKVSLCLLALGLMVIFWWMPRNPRPRAADPAALELGSRTTLDGPPHGSGS